MANLLNLWKKNHRHYQEFSNKNKIQQLIEILYFRFRGFSPSSYYAIPLSTEFGKRPLVSDVDYDRFEKQLNPRQNGVVPFNKWVQSCFWKANGLPHASTFGYLNNKTGILNGKSIKISAKELALFFEKAMFPIVIKPIDGANGIGFDIIEKYNKIDDTIVTCKLGTITISSFISDCLNGYKNSQGYILQEYITQHIGLSAFYNYSVNSLRVVTHMDKDNNVSVDCALMKFGAGKSITDNDNVDGRVFAFMDIDNGSLGKGFTGALSQNQIEFHPDSKLRIFEYIIPFWKESLDLAISAHCHLPYPRHLGWDIAITDQGPIIIELNSFLAISVYQKGGNDLLTATAFGESFKEFIQA